MDKFRSRIDIIDESMQNLFIERMQIVEQVAKFKKENNLPVHDPNREKAIITKNVEEIDYPELKDLYEEFFLKVIEVSKKYQERILDENE
jgi:chorismate mutase/prephenate dehydratase